jgi:hypothetical protein
MWGISPFCRRCGVEAGDHLLLDFDLEALHHNDTTVWL